MILPAFLTLPSLMLNNVEVTMKVSNRINHLLYTRISHPTFEYRVYAHIRIIVFHIS
jgi:hypothetical protein